MRVKTKIIISSLACILMLFIFAFGSFVYASEIKKEDFSEYLNCYKGDIYTESTYIKPLTKVNYYNVGSECYNKYGTKEIEATTPKYQEYGFKVNGEFYLSAYQLTESGAYKIEVFFYEKDNNGYYKARGSSLESFYIFVDLSFNVEQTKTNFYYEYYENAEKFVEDVRLSFNQNVTLSTSTKNTLTNFFNKYNGENKAIGLEVNYKNVTYNFTINLLPLSEIKATFLPLEEVAKEARLGQAYSYENSFSNALYITDILEARILSNINSKLNLADGQKCEIKINDKVKTKSFGSSFFQTYTIPMTISEINTNEEIYINLPILIYKEKYLENKKDFMKISFASNEYFETQNVINSYYTYLKFTENSIDYFDYLNNPILTKWGLNLVKEEINYSLKILEIEESYSEAIKIVEENSKPKILTRYNYIVLPKKDSLAFENQIKIICSNPYEVNYNIVEINGEDWLSIEVNSLETKELIISKIEKIVYSGNNMNSFQKILYSYGCFLRKIFS